MNCMDDQVDIFQLQLTPENWKLFASEMESPTSEVKLKELASSGLTAPFWDEVYRVKRLND